MKLTEIQATSKDTEWLWCLYVGLLKPSITDQWGWDQKFQEERFATHLPTEKFRIITVSDTRVAAYLVNREADHHYVKMILVTGEYQNKGIGKTIIHQLKLSANTDTMPLRHSVIKANPVLGYYKKPGFTICGEDKDSTVLVYNG